MTEEEVYLQSILKEIESLKLKNRAGLFRMGDNISDRTANYVKTYFDKDSEHYEIEIRKCQHCKQSWDIIIFFRKL